MTARPPHRRLVPPRRPTAVALLWAASLAIAVAPTLARGQIPSAGVTPPVPEPGAWTVETTVSGGAAHGNAGPHSRTELEQACIAPAEVAGSWPGFIGRDLDADCRLEPLRQTRTTIRFVQRCGDSRLEGVVTAQDPRRWRMQARAIEGKDAVTAEIRSEWRWVGPTC